MLINFTVSGDRNVIRTEAGKNLNYEDLKIEMQRVWNVKTKVVPVMVGAAGTVSRSSRKRQSNVPGKHEIKELHKTAILGTAHVLRKALMQQYEILNMGSNVTCTVP
jgi:3-deoxy-D-manno-octulosonic acid (KDO) 8-phosphate synthase